MLSKITKHLTIKTRCLDCRKKFTNRLIAEVNPNFNMLDLKNKVKVFPLNITACPKCKSEKIEQSFSFFHEEKLINNTVKQ